MLWTGASFHRTVCCGLCLYQYRSVNRVHDTSCGQCVNLYQPTVSPLDWIPVSLFFHWCSESAEVVMKCMKSSSLRKLSQSTSNGCNGGQTECYWCVSACVLSLLGEFHFRNVWGSFLKGLLKFFCFCFCLFGSFCVSLSPCLLPLLSLSLSLSVTLSLCFCLSLSLSVLLFLSVFFCLSLSISFLSLSLSLLSLSLPTPP